MKRAALRMVPLVILVLTLVGCWDYREIEVLDFVLGGGIESVEPDVILVTEMAKSTGTQQETEFQPVVLTTQAPSFAGATRSLHTPTEREVFWPHAEVFLVSEEVARQGMLEVTEFVLRAPEMRSTMYMFVTKECKVEEVFKSKPPLFDSVSQHLMGSVRLANMTTVYIPTQVWKFSGDMAAEGVSSTLPTVQLVNEAGDMVPVVKGTAVFKKDKMVGWLDAEETQLFSLLSGATQHSFFVMQTRLGEMVYPISYQFRGNQVQIKPVVDGERLSMEVSLYLQLGVVELGKATMTLSDSVIRSMEEQLSHAFARRIDDFFSLIQKEYNTDILGFGQMLMRKHPDAWRSRSDNWDTIFPTLPVETKVKCRIVLTGLRRDPMKVRD